MEYGYGRVSATDQNEGRQVAALTEAGIPARNIIIDKQSGKDFDRRGFNLLVGTNDTAPLLRKGDLLTVCSLDRFGRNYCEIVKWWQFITRELQADIRILDMPLLDTRQGGGSLDTRFIADLVLQILSYVAERERESIRKRQAEGNENLKRTGHTVDRVTGTGKKYISAKTGRAVGRPEVEYPENWQEVYTSWKNGEITAVQAMNETGLKKNSFYNLVKRYENGASR